MLQDVITLNKNSEVTPVTQPSDSSQSDVSADDKSDTDRDTDFNFSFSECFAEFNEKNQNQRKNSLLMTERILLVN